MSAMTATQLHLWLGRWAAALPPAWPMVPPWGDLSDHRIVDVVEFQPRRHAVLLQRARHHWHLCLYEGRPYASGAGWKDVAGRPYRHQEAVA